MIRNPWDRAIDAHWTTCQQRDPDRCPQCAWLFGRRAASHELPGVGRPVLIWLTLSLLMFASVTAVALTLL